MVFRLPTEIVFGKGVLGSLREIIKGKFHASRVFLVTDSGIKESGILKRALSQLEEVTVFDRVESNPRNTTVDSAAELARQNNPDLVIGLGGGSPIDAAKAVALLATNKGGIEEYEGREKYRIPPLPVVAVPTTCGTGSEVTWVSVITHTGKRFKMSIKGTRLFPALALVDPDLLTTLPPSLVASTGMDALTHAIEAYTAKGASTISDVFARKAIQLIVSFLERAFKNIKGDGEARENMMLASMMAGIAFGNSDVGAVHCLAEAVGGLYDLPHGELNSVFLPFVMEFNLPSAVERYGEIASFGGIGEGSRKRAAEKLIERVKVLSRTLGIPHFKDFGIDESQFSGIAQKAFMNNSNPSNPRETKADDYVAILKRASKH